MRHPLGLTPSKILAVHLNYRSRAAERGRTPATPSYFLKPPSSLSRDGAPVIRPRGCELLAYEGEIAVVIGERAHRVGLPDALDHVAGYAAACDFGVYDLRYADRGANVRSKGQDGYTPVGPVLLDAREHDPSRLRLRTWVNGTLVQDATTEELIFSFAHLIADLSRLITLEPGDLILTGTPAGAGTVRPGDVVEVDLADAGRLRNEITEADHDLAPIGAMPKTSPADRAAANATPPVPIGATPKTSPADHVTAGAEPPIPGRATPKASPADRTAANADPPVPIGATPKASPADRAAAGAEPPIPGRVMPKASAADRVADGAEAPVPGRTLELLATVSTATLSSCLRRHGIRDHVIDGVRPTRPDLRMVGTAATLRYVPFREDVFAEHGGGMNAQKRAVDEIGPGQVLVIEARGDITAGTIGDILALRALRRGAAGVVTDGGLRDSPSFATLDLPAYYAAPHPAVLGRRHVPLDIGIPVTCGGTLVMPGDVLAGDAEGVVVIPAALATEIADEAVEQERQEHFIYQRVSDGAAIAGLYPMDARRRAEYDQWRTRQSEPE